MALKDKKKEKCFDNLYTDEFSRSKARSNLYRSAFIQLRNQKKWNPDIVISHSGWGCGLHVKEIWPETTLITYLEWWFNPNSELALAMKKNKNLNYSSKSIEKMWLRNIPISFELSTADHIIAPSRWQKQQLPKQLIKNCHVIYDGIDQNIFHFEESQISKTPKLTYGTRGMEAMRCFPEFIKSLPLIISKWPTLKVEIAGEDEICYGGSQPKEGSWGAWAKSYLQQNGVPDGKVEWKGRLELREYLKWLRGSWCHIYLTQPFVPSWSLLEAICCGTPLVVNKCPATEEFLGLAKTICVVDDLSVESISSAVASQLRNRSRWQPVSAETLETLDHKASLKKWRRIADAHLPTAD
tara:strand:+ start:3379 stop:4440 length:1062 start_codon:yes stop_codon:yes gene_type:complete